MTLFYDISESRIGSRLPDDVIAYGYRWEGVEAETGADFVVVPEISITHKAIILGKQGLSAAQIAKKLDVSIPDVVKMRLADDGMNGMLYDYLYRGAVAVQRKSGNDLIASIQGPRLDESISRMYRAVPYRCQRVLLYTGNFTESDGKVVVDGRETGLAYMAFVMALTAWGNRGGTVVNLASDDMILAWIKLLEKQLAEYAQESIKHVFPASYFPPDLPDEDDVLQVPVEVTDWRKTLITFPGVGPDKATSLKSYLDELYGSSTLITALQYAVSMQTTKDVHGWGKKTVEGCRRWLGLKPDDDVLTLDILRKNK